MPAVCRCFVYDKRDGGVKVRPHREQSSVQRARPTCELVFTGRPRTSGRRPQKWRFCIKYVMSLTERPHVLGIAATVYACFARRLPRGVEVCRRAEQFGKADHSASRRIGMLSQHGGQARWPHGRAALRTARFVDIYKSVNRYLRTSVRWKSTSVPRLKYVYKPPAGRLHASLPRCSLRSIANQVLFDSIHTRRLGLHEDYACERLYRDARS